MLGTITGKRNNCAAVRLKYRVRGSTSWTTVTLATDVTTISYTNVVLPAVTFDAATTYEILAEIEDKKNTGTAQRTLDAVPPAQPLNFKPNGRNLGIGVTNDVDYSVRVGWPAQFDDAVNFGKSPTFSGTELSTFVNMLKGAGISLRKLMYDTTLQAPAYAGSDSFGYAVPAGEGDEGCVYEYELSIIGSDLSSLDANYLIWVNNDVTIADYRRAHYKNGSDYSTKILVAYSDGRNYGPSITVGTNNRTTGAGNTSS